MCLQLCLGRFRWRTLKNVYGRADKGKFFLPFSNLFSITDQRNRHRNKAKPQLLASMHTLHRIAWLRGVKKDKSYLAIKSCSVCWPNVSCISFSLMSTPSLNATSHLFRLPWGDWNFLAASAILHVSSTSAAKTNMANHHKISPLWSVVQNMSYWPWNTAALLQLRASAFFTTLSWPRSIIKKTDLLVACPTSRNHG